MRDYQRHLILENATVRDALLKLNSLGDDAILFVVDDSDKLLGALTDGDVRRGLLKGKSIEDLVKEIMQLEPKSVSNLGKNFEETLCLRSKNYEVIPVVTDKCKVVDIINFRLLKSYLPLDAVIMAGGKGERLRPLTNQTPKSLLPVGDKSIIEHNIDNLSRYGINNFWISLNYLGKKLTTFLGSGEVKDININYIWEDQPLGTIGAASKIRGLNHDDILVTNSDILTNLDYEKFYIDFKNRDVDVSIACVPYKVNVPYAVLEQDQNGYITSLKEKPTFTFFSNGGIYLMKKSVLNLIPENKFFNATDLIELLISKNKKVISYSWDGYWLDIGSPEDYRKANLDIKKVSFK